MAHFYNCWSSCIVLFGVAVSLCGPSSVYFNIWFMIIFSVFFFFFNNFCFSIVDLSMLPVLIKLCVLNTKYYSLVLSCSKLWVYYISIGMYCNMRCIAQYAYILIHEVVHSFRYHRLAKDRRLWLILSNALEKSMISTASWHHFSTASDTSSMNPSNWDSQDLPQQKPRCSG